MLSYFPWASSGSDQTAEIPCIISWHSGWEWHAWACSDVFHLHLLWSWSPSVVLLLFGHYCRSPAPVWSSWEWGQASAGSLLGPFTRARMFWAKCLGCGNGLLTLACSPHHAACITYTAGTWLLSHLVKCIHAGGWRTGSVLRRCLLVHISLSEHGPLGALGLQASRFCASHADRRDGLFFFFFSFFPCLVCCPRVPCVEYGGLD